MGLLGNGVHRVEQIVRYGEARPSNVFLSPEMTRQLLSLYALRTLCSVYWVFVAAL